VAKDGEAWEIGSNDLNCPQAGKDYSVPQPSPVYWEHPRHTRDYLDQDDLTASHWSSRGWEIPRRLSQAPQEAVDLAFAGLGRIDLKPEDCRL
jgi:hypothetical protein